MSSRKNAVQRRRQIVRLRARDGDDCWLCGEPMEFPAIRTMHRRLATIDHVTPLYEGGSNRLDNLRLAHMKCNNVRRGRESMRPDPNGNDQHRFYVSGRRHRATRYWEMFKRLDAEGMLR